MGLLDRFFGNNHRLTPHFKGVKQIELDFSGTKLRFKGSAHATIFPINGPHYLDIYDKDALKQYSDRLVKSFYDFHLNFLDKKNQTLGTCVFRSFLYYLPAKYPRGSYFSRPILEQEIIEHCHRVWGDQNPGSSLGALGPEGNYVYPVDASGFSYQRINDVNWCRFTAQWKGDAPEIHYACPISKHHFIINEFGFYTSDGIDFYNPETNLEQACYDAINDFMSEYFIELSPRAQAEKADASDPV